MTSSEIARLDDEHVVATTAPFAQAPLAVQMDYARAVSSAALLPHAYRNKPADIMLAVGLGSAMGLSPAESLYRIDVIQGKPTASAELIAANVRKAGHRLRVKIDEANVAVTATIIRSDDPDDPNPPTITRDRKWAQAMGLAGKDNYQKQPLTMLQWRAITAVARLACPEALYGVAYTADEMADMPHSPSGGGLAAALGTTTAEQIHDDDSPAAAAGVEATGGEIPSSPPESPSLNMRSKLAKHMFAILGEAGYSDDTAQRDRIIEIIGRPITSRKELTDADAERVIAETQEQLEAPFPSSGDES